VGKKIPMSYCNWGNASDVTQRYHDEEWGMPVHDDVRQFEYLVINDHGCDCPRYAVVNAATEPVRKRRDHEQGVVNFGS
jgi:hypothetical protein